MRMRGLMRGFFGLVSMASLFFLGLGAICGLGGSYEMATSLNRDFFDAGSLRWSMYQMSQSRAAACSRRDARTTSSHCWSRRPDCRLDASCPFPVGFLLKPALFADWRSAGAFVWFSLTCSVWPIVDELATGPKVPCRLIVLYGNQGDALAIPLALGEDDAQPNRASQSPGG